MRNLVTVVGGTNELIRTRGGRRSDPGYPTNHVRKSFRQRVRLPDGGSGEETL